MGGGLGSPDQDPAGDRGDPLDRPARLASVGLVHQLDRGLGVVQFVLEPATIAFLGFSDLSQVGNVDNRSVYSISPVVWAASVVLLLALALRYAPTRAGWALAVLASVLVSPRLLMYQLSTLLAAVRAPDDEVRAVAPAAGVPSGAVGGLADPAGSQR